MTFRHEAELDCKLEHDAACRATLTQHHTLVFNLYHSWGNVQELFQEARLFVATHDSWSKYAAKEAPRVVSKNLRDLGVVFIDEASISLSIYIYITLLPCLSLLLTRRR